MNDDAHLNLRAQFVGLEQAVGFGLFSILLGVSFFNVSVSLLVISWALIHDVFYGQFGPVTEFVIHNPGLLFAASLAFPVAGALIWWFASGARAMILISVLVVAAALQTAVTWSALIGPVFYETELRVVPERHNGYG